MLKSSRLAEVDVMDDDAEAIVSAWGTSSMPSDKLDERIGAPSIAAPPPSAKTVERVLVSVFTSEIYYASDEVSSAIIT